MMDQLVLKERRTTVDVIFENLYEDIISLKLMPGTKISEAEIAAQYGVSRQPVRDAFARLGNLGFLLIRPQKATEVQKFSNETIATARFIRTAIEVEVARRAAARWNGHHASAFEENLALQDKAARDNDRDIFHQLDFDFHRQLCEAAGTSAAFDTILENKAQVDRICVLSMMDQSTLKDLVNDHHEIYDRLRASDGNGIETAIRRHLSKIEGTIACLRESHPEYFF